MNKKLDRQQSSRCPSEHPAPTHSNSPFSREGEKEDGTRNSLREMVNPSPLGPYVMKVCLATSLKAQTERCLRDRGETSRPSCRFCRKEPAENSYRIVHVAWVWKIMAFFSWTNCTENTIAEARFWIPGQVVAARIQLVALVRFWQVGSLILADASSAKPGSIHSLGLRVLSVFVTTWVFAALCPARSSLVARK